MRSTPEWCVLLALLLAPAAAARAQQPQRTDAAHKDHPPKQEEVVDLRFRGVESVDEDELRKSVATDESHCLSFFLKPVCWISKSKYFYRREYLDHEELARDVLRVRVFYWKRGFRETGVDTVVTDRGNDKVAVRFDVAEGPPTLVSDITVNQTQQVLSPPEVSRRLVLSKGTPLNLLRLDSTRVFLEQSLWDKGYADAVVDTAVALDSAGRSAAITLNIDPKQKATIAEIVIEGEQKIDEATIRRSLTLRPGDVFRRSELLRSQRGLYESNLFRRAAIEVPTQGDSAKTLVVTVQEAPLREARLSTGFNTVDFVQFEGRFTHYNFSGGARRLEVQGAVGNLFARSLNNRFIFKNVTENVGSERGRFLSPTYNASINMRQPWFLSQANELALGVFSHRRSAPGVYVDRGYGLSATFTRMLTERAPASLNYRFEIANIDAGDVYFCVNYTVCDRPTLDALRRQQRLSPLALTGNLERTNDPLSPSRGMRGVAALEHASGLTASDFRYNRATSDASAYQPFRKRGVLAGRARLGWVNALESTREAVGVELGVDVLHPRKRFYAGGSRSVRGFGENQLGPRVLTVPAATLRRATEGCAAAIPITRCDPNAEQLRDRDFEPRPLGGNFVAEGSVELRFPVWENLTGAGFIDAGYVAQRINPALPKSKAAVTPGIGVRYLSLVGPIRVDLGINPATPELLPVVSEAVVDGETRLVTLQQNRRYSPFRGGLGGFLNRVVLHLSIGEAF